jgi:hypothetical protein
MERMVSFAIPAALISGKAVLFGPTTLLDALETGNHFPLQGIEPRFLENPSRIPVTILRYSYCYVGSYTVGYADFCSENKGI